MKSSASSRQVVDRRVARSDLLRESIPIQMKRTRRRRKFAWLPKGLQVDLRNSYVPAPSRPLHLAHQLHLGHPRPRSAASETTQNHVIYVWLDALANYMTAIGYGSEAPEDTPSSTLLARRPPPRRQRDHPLPLRLLARLPARRRDLPTAESPDHRQRLAPLRRLEDVEVPRQRRPHRNHPRRLRHLAPVGRSHGFSVPKRSFP